MQNPPALGLSQRILQEDGSEFFVSAEGDAVELFVLESGRVQSLSMTPRTALALARFLVWRWWVCGLLFGLRLWWWERAVFAAPKDLPQNPPSSAP